MAEEEITLHVFTKKKCCCKFCRECLDRPDGGDRAPVEDADAQPLGVDAGGQQVVVASAALGRRRHARGLGAGEPGEGSAVHLRKQPPEHHRHPRAVPGAAVGRQVRGEEGAQVRADSGLVHVGGEVRLRRSRQSSRSGALTGRGGRADSWRHQHHRLPRGDAQW